MAIGVIPEIPSPKESKSSVDFNDLKLSEIDLKESRRNEKIIKKNARVEVAIEGKTFPLFVEYGETPGSIILVRFFLCKPGTQLPPMPEVGGLLNAYMTFKFNDPTHEHKNIATTSILKEKGESGLPQGLGVSMYKKMLDYIQYQATFIHKDLTHHVSHDPHMGLDSEKWARIFRPILIERGYERNYNLSEYAAGEEWRKEYKP